jgi:hypothetical protein
LQNYNEEWCSYSGQWRFSHDNLKKAAGSLPVGSTWGTPQTLIPWTTEDFHTFRTSGWSAIGDPSTQFSVGACAVKTLESSQVHVRFKFHVTICYKV